MYFNPLMIVLYPTSSREHSFCEDFIQNLAHYDKLCQRSTHFTHVCITEQAILHIYQLYTQYFIKNSGKNHVIKFDFIKSFLF